MDTYSVSRHYLCIRCTKNANRRTHVWFLFTVLAVVCTPRSRDAFQEQSRTEVVVAFSETWLGAGVASTRDLPSVDPTVPSLFASGTWPTGESSARTGWRWVSKMTSKSSTSARSVIARQKNITDDKCLQRTRGSRGVKGRGSLNKVLLVVSFQYKACRTKNYFLHSVRNASRDRGPRNGVLGFALGPTIESSVSWRIVYTVQEPVLITHFNYEHWNKLYQNYWRNRLSHQRSSCCSTSIRRQTTIQVYNLN